MNEDIIEFYVEKFEYLERSEDADLDFVPPLLRRRMSKMDKVAVALMNKCMCVDVDYLVFSSNNGEVEKLLKIINQYSTIGEVSPALFSGSVHNYCAGLFLLNAKKTIPYNALSGGENSISSGILSAVASNYNDIIYCYVDKIEDDFGGFAIKISKNMKKSSKKCIIRKRSSDKIDNFDEFINFFSSKIPLLKSYIFELESV